MHPSKRKRRGGQRHAAALAARRQRQNQTVSVLDLMRQDSAPAKGSVKRMGSRSPGRVAKDSQGGLSDWTRTPYFATPVSVDARWGQTRREVARSDTPVGRE